jgi:hypothetical protein
METPLSREGERCFLITDSGFFHARLELARDVLGGDAPLQQLLLDLPGRCAAAPRRIHEMACEPLVADETGFCEASEKFVHQGAGAFALLFVRCEANPSLKDVPKLAPGGVVAIQIAESDLAKASLAEIRLSLVAPLF